MRRKLLSLFYFYEIFYRAIDRMDKLLRCDLPMRPPGIPNGYLIFRRKQGTLRHPAAIQRENQGDGLGSDRPVAERQNLSERRVPRVF